MNTPNNKSDESGLFNKVFWNEILKLYKPHVKPLYIDYKNLSLEGYKTIFNAKPLVGILLIPIFAIFIILGFCGIISIILNGWDWVFLFLLFMIICCGFGSYELLNSIYMAYRAYIKAEENYRTKINNKQ